jgi:hypothetical protein
MTAVVCCIARDSVFAAYACMYWLTTACRFHFLCFGTETAWYPLSASIAWFWLCRRQISTHMASRETDRLSTHTNRDAGCRVRGDVVMHTCCHVMHAQLLDTWWAEKEDGKDGACQGCLLTDLHACEFAGVCTRISHRSHLMCSLLRWHCCI